MSPVAWVEFREGRVFFLEEKRKKKKKKRQKRKKKKMEIEIENGYVIFAYVIRRDAAFT